MGEKRTAYRLLVGKPEGKRPLGRPKRRWVKILKWILERYDGMEWIGWIWLRIGTSEHGIEPSGSIKCWEVLEGLHNWRLLKKGSAP
jgi:hypothetical protein